uniref:N-terminal kinase-like protein n=1 Tax=Picea sitchensis TaxID=3332 RepID=B8LRZ8_PICSI|nr:unknown [Picea sitchensis]
MEVLNLKDSVEKDSFFRKLPNLAEQLPRQIVLKKLLPMLASSLEFGSAAAPALNSLLKLGSWLSTDEFNSKVLPTIVKLFASNDRAIRVGLLQHIDQYGASLSAQIVDEQVYVHVATGFSDTSAFLRELTLKAMLILIPKLSQRTITGSLLKYLSKLQVDEEPAIRTNTTILLGNIASYLNEGTRRRVLINAFTVRALRDGFAPARAAGLMALSATSTYYDPTEIATRILPNVVVLTVDPDSDVRSKAFEAIDLFLQSMKQHHEKGDAATDSRTMANVGSASLLGWAMSSLTLKGKGSEQVLASSSNSVVASAHQVTTSSNNAALYVSDTPATNLSSAVDHIDHPPSPTSTDGWGDIDENGVQEEESDKDGWDDIEVMEEKKPPAPLATIHAAQQRPIVQTKLPGANSLPSRHQSRVSKDVTKVSDDEDPWAAIAAPQPTTKVKSLSVTSASSRDDNDPWAAIAAPPPSTTVKPLSATTTARIRSSSENSNRPNSANIHPSGSGRGRGSKTAPMKLGAQRLSRNSEL